MAEEQNQNQNQAALMPVERPLNLIPVGLKEAALDSPTSRATAVHFAEQIEIVERWLDGYVKAASRLVNEASSLESLVNTFLAQSTPPAQISEAVLDHDYTMLAMKRYGEGAREFWQYTLGGIKKYESTVVGPIKGFMNNELRSFKEARRVLEASQKQFDTILARYSSQGKSKEPSSLREDAFQLHEARRAYLKASMDFCMLAPQVRATLDKLLVKVFAEQWRDMRATREVNNSMFTKWSSEMDRVRGWSKEMENSERAFKRELLAARKQIEESAEQMTRPSRQLEDYELSTVPFLGATAPPQTPAKSGSERAEKQGWLFLRSITGKPARTVWSRRWFFVKNGIFGWLLQGTRSGGVEESEKTGVLLCSVRPAFQEERRFCFEVKTKDTSIILQAETQQELTDWIQAFEVAKRKALEDPASTETSPAAPGVDPAFAISPPIAPEFAAKVGDHAAQSSDDLSSTLSLPDTGITSRSSFDVSATRKATMPEVGEGSRDHAARIIQKLDLHKRATAGAQVNQAAAAGGIASLISASHNILPVGPGATQQIAGAEKRSFTMPTSSLAPSTLANPPAPTNLSHTAVVVSGEKGFGLGRPDGSGMPSGIMANLWGSSNWGYVNRLEREESPQRRVASQPPSPAAKPLGLSVDDSGIMDSTTGTPKEMTSGENLAPVPPRGSHRKSISLNTQDVTPKSATFANDDFPNYYPLPLKAQQAQFRMLFPTVSQAEKVVLVFRATWNPNEQQEFPGRVYVTAKEIYFYSNHLGLVLITGVKLSSVSDVTAAPGRDCDFLYLHLKENNGQDSLRRVTVKTFLEPLKLLQRRLNFLVHNVSDENPLGLEEILKTLIKMEVELPERSSSIESWDEITYSPDEKDSGRPAKQGERDIKTSLRIDGNLYGDPVKTGREIQKFKLPSQAVAYAPQGMTASVVREFNISAKALFHLMFGDKSAVFQLLYCNRWSNNIVQSPWIQPEGGHWTRNFTSPSSSTPFSDVQTIDILNDHLCYVVTNNKTPWRLPYSSSFNLTSKLVITHIAKSRCKLAVYQQVSWYKTPLLGLSRRLVEKQALNDLRADAIDLTTVANDQVAKLGSHSKTNKAVQIFGNIGLHTQPAQLDGATAPPLVALSSLRRKQAKKRTMLSLYADEAFAQIFGLIGMVFDLVIALAKSVVGVCSAHSLLVALLAVSMLYNSWHSYRDGVTWYHERSAGQFMSRLGVVPEPVMGKALYLSDIEEFTMPTVQNNTMAALASDGADAGKSCRTTFQDQITAVDGFPSQRTGVRLHRTRDALARYRHDLLVAMRVVNRIERDVVSAEWEDWVREEARKCSKVEDMLKNQRAGKRGAKQDIAVVDMDLGEEFAEYCQTCRTELTGIANGTSLL